MNQQQLTALRTAEATFRRYGNLHAAKPDPVKAAANYELADQMAAALGDVQPSNGHVVSPTAGMNIYQRILHVGGRDNAAGYVEFGSAQAVEALVQHVLRDLPSAPAAQQPELEPVCGDLLPPINSRVFIRHGRDDDAHACIVTGYYVWGVDGSVRLNRVFVRMVYEGTTTAQARMLHECFKTKEAALSHTCVQSADGSREAAPIGALKVNQSMVDDLIVGEHYFTAVDGIIGDVRAKIHTGESVKMTDIGILEMMDGPARLLTFCVLVLKNGSTVHGSCTDLNAEKVDQSISRQVARANAEANLRPLIAYAERERLSQQSST